MIEGIEGFEGSLGLLSQSRERGTVDELGNAARQVSAHTAPRTTRDHGTRGRVGLTSPSTVLLPRSRPERRDISPARLGAQLLNYVTTLLATSLTNWNKSGLDSDRACGRGVQVGKQRGRGRAAGPARPSPSPSPALLHERPSRGHTRPSRGHTRRGSWRRDEAASLRRRSRAASGGGHGGDGEKSRERRAHGQGKREAG